MRLTGSSPLARGLRPPKISSSLLIRIIPARAGFTIRPARGVFGAGDHPRSRGVYTMMAALRVVLPGSSPLARGLRREDHHVAARRGIIPARAGFTCCMLERLASHVGSSPLARGLPSLDRVKNDAKRIIPARAGFTRVGAALVFGGRDHPRSRGVYLTTGSKEGPGGGSSPLARGLLGQSSART